MGSSAPRRQSGAPALSILLLSHSLGCSPDLHGWIQVPWNISSPGFWKGNTEPQPGKAACLRLEMTPELHISLLLTFHCPVLGHVIISSVQSLSRVRLFATPWIAARQASLSVTISQSSLKLTSIKSVMPSSHLILCRPLFLLPPIPPSIRSYLPAEEVGKLVSECKCAQEGENEFRGGGNEVCRDLEGYS